ncbi:hypothetical protein [Streptomyces sp. NPDC045714]|uniref:hypothetical protein n=1 Tax=Streptomyces sp. NPDC045714 TaxID=3154913 RepID=UPI0034070921
MRSLPGLSPRASGGRERYLDRSLPEEIGADPLAKAVARALEHLRERFGEETPAAARPPARP